MPPVEAKHSAWPRTLSPTLRGVDVAIARTLPRLAHRDEEALRGRRRTLRRFTEGTVAGEAGPLAENDLMNPDHVPRSLTRTVQRFIAGLGG